MGVYDTLVLPGTRADGEQVKCWFNDMRSISVGDEVPPMKMVQLHEVPLEDGAEEVVDVADYVIVMHCDGCLVVRDCKLQGYFLPAVLVPGDPPVQALPFFDKWGEPWVSSAHNCGFMGEPYSYVEANVSRSVENLARARPPKSADQDVR